MLDLVAAELEQEEELRAQHARDKKQVLLHQRLRWSGCRWLKLPCCTCNLNNRGYLWPCMRFASCKFDACFQQPTIPLRGSLWVYCISETLGLVVVQPDHPFMHVIPVSYSRPTIN